eukprot:TRINITY_DN5541_c0_g1_i1.p1 TRINITY_DN5541_c0_g1~~TRINITY_DN5541_c0_g1_i1.p1  ORF type:complete len:653 (-),score=217.11 TRINITY_DN5541_c0_g1_i1:313-2271(-)
MDSPLSKESFLSSLTTLSRHQGSSLWRLWEEMGCSEGNLSAYRSRVVLECIEEKFRDMISEEESHKSSLVRRIDDHYRRLLSLSEELSCSPVEPSEELSLIQLEKELRDVVEGLKEKKKELLKEMKALKDKEETLASALGETASNLSLLRIPSSGERQALSKRVDQLAELKKDRLKSFMELKASIVSAMSDLCTEPSNSFERSIVCERDESFLPLSEERIRKVRGVFVGLQEQKARNAEQANRMRDKILSISRKLDLDDSDFLAENRGSSPNELKELQFRLDELELLKAQHMERFLVAARKELDEWWDRCFYTQRQRSLFAPYFSHDYTEDVLSKHEVEIENIKSYFTANEALFQMVEQRQDLWAKKLELERKAKDPNRFQCKSTEFLKEERDRKRVEKQLPKIEKNLEDAMEEYRVENGEDFLVGGIPYSTYMEIQIREHEESLQREKMEKAQAKKQLIIQESRYGSTPAKLNSTKRKAPHTVDVNLSKKQRTDVTRGGTINSTRSSTRSTLTRSISTRTVSRYTTTTTSNRSRYAPDASFVTGSGEFKMSLRSLDDKNPFLNPNGINANSTLQSELTPRQVKKTPRTALTTGGRALSRRSRSATTLGSNKSPTVSAKKSLFKTPVLKRAFTPSCSSSIKGSTCRTARKKL